MAGKEGDNVGAAGDGREHDVGLDVLVDVVVRLGLEGRAGRVDGAKRRQRRVLPCGAGSAQLWDGLGCET